MMFLLEPIRRYLIGGLMVSGLALTGYLYYNATQAKMALLEERAIALTEQVDQLTQANESLSTTLVEVRMETARIQELNRTLQISISESEARTNELRRILMDHDLTMLSLQRPGLIERRVNDATQNVFDDIESLTAR